jgi:hypothetical protein
MDTSEKKVENPEAETPEKPQPTSPKQKSRPEKLIYNRYGTPVNGINRSDKAPFGYHPETGELLAPFGLKSGTNIPRKRRAPPARSTANAHSAYLKKREKNISSKVKNDLIKDLFGDRFQKPKEIKLEVKNDTNDIDSESEEEMPRKQKEESNYAPYLVALAVAGVGYYMFAKKKPAPKPPSNNTQTYQPISQEQNSPECIYSTEF